MKNLRFLNEMKVCFLQEDLVSQEIKKAVAVDKLYFVDFNLRPYEYIDCVAQEVITAYNNEDRHIDASYYAYRMFALPLNKDVPQEVRTCNSSYVDKVIFSLENITNQFKYVRQVYLFDEREKLYYTVYLLSSEDGMNQSCIVALGSMFTDVEGEIYPAVLDTTFQFFSRNAPLFTKLYKNFARNVDFSEKQFLVASSSASFINIPVMHRGVLLTESPENEQFYEDIFAFVSNILRQFFHVREYLWMQREESIALAGEESCSLPFFSRNRMKPYLCNVMDIDDKELINEILEKGKAERKYPLWNNDTEMSLGFVEEHYILYVTDWKCTPTPSRVKVLYVFHWKNGKDEISVSFGKIKMEKYLELFDEYVLENRMPLLYRSYINGKMGRFEEGALMQTTQLSYYKYEYPQTVKDSLDNILRRVDSDCFNMLREEYKFNDYLQKKDVDEERRKDEARSEANERVVIGVGLSKVAQFVGSLLLGSGS